MILDMRKLEMAALSKQKYLDALCVFFWAITPTIIKLLTFATSTVIGQPLTAATAFASVALLNMLIGPLNAFPWVLNGLVEAYVSLKRIQSYIDVRIKYIKFPYRHIFVQYVFEFTIIFYLQLNDIDLHKYYSKLEPQTPTDEESSKRPVIISLRNASFHYHRIDQSESDNSTSGNRNFFIGPITGDIKKVTHFNISSFQLDFRNFQVRICILHFRVISFV